MKLPKTKFKDLQAYLEEKSRLEDNFLRGSLSREEAKRKLAKLDKKYVRRVFPEDRYFFDSADKYIVFIRGELGPEFEVGLQHELAHAREAQIQGMGVQYGCYVFTETGSLSVGAKLFVRVFPKGGKMSKKKLRRVARASRNIGDTSEEDRRCMNLY